MKFKPIRNLFLLTFLVSCTSNESINETINETSAPVIQKLTVDDENVKKFYFKGEAFSLSGLVVKVLTFKSIAWDEGVEIKDYNSSIQEGSILNEVGESKVTISYKNFVSHEFTISIVDSSLYKTNDDFSFAITSINGEALNMKTLGDNTSSTSYLDPLGENNHILVVPYYFSEDENIATEENRKKIENAFFATQQEAKNNNQPYSVKSFYEASSFNKTTFDGDVIPWFKSSVGNSENLKNGGFEAAEDIYSNYTNEYNKTNHGILGPDAKPWSYYDGNNDGYIDLLWIVYSKDRVEGGTDQWWAYTSHDGSSYKANTARPVVKTFCWASFSFLWGDSDPHTYTHETGHAFGLSDYYDYNKYWSPMGKIDMMDNNVGDHCAYSKFSLGWINPLVVNETSIIKLKPYMTSGESILLPSPNYNNTAFDEYLLVEYITPQGLSSDDYFSNTQSTTGYTKSGIRITHVDSRAYYESRKKPLENKEDILLSATELCYDNSHFGRNSNNDAKNVTTDLFEAENNPSNKDRSYSLINVIPASYNKETNNMTSVTTLDNSALFKKGNSFSFSDSYTEFLPSYSNLWDKARKVSSSVSVDTTYTIDYTINIRDINDTEATLEIIRG